MGKKLWYVVVAVLAIIVVTAVVGYLVSRSNRVIHAVTVVPFDAELAEGTDIVFRRGNVGSVGRLDTATWGLQAELHVHDGIEHRLPVSVLTRIVAVAPGVPSVMMELQRSAAGVVFHLRQDSMDLRLGRSGGAWVDGTSPSRTRVLVNGRLVTSKDSTLRLYPGDNVSLQGADLRIGKFMRLTPAALRFTTRNLCPLRGLAKFVPWRPTKKERTTCRDQNLRGDAQLGIGGSFGLTKPTLKLAPSTGGAGIVLQDPIASGKDTVVIALAPSTDLMAEVEQIVAYLNSPVDARPYPRTHFEHSVANVDSMVRSITATANQVNSTVGKVDASLRSPDGLAPMLLGEGASESLREALQGAASLTTRLADPTGTLVQNVGLEPALSRATGSIARADTTVGLIRQQVLRLGPRAELAIDQATRSMEGAEGTVQSLKTVAEDVTDLKKKLTGPIGYGALGAVIVGIIANMKWIVR